MGALRECTYVSTTAGADITISTKAGSLVGVICYGSAAGTTLTIVDSGGSIIGLINASSLDSVVFAPALPVAVQNGITVTASGTGGYSIFYV